MLYEKSHLPQGHMEKQEIEMKWKLEMGTGNWKLETQSLSCCSHSNVVGFALATQL